jgi:hypothetical protein
MRTTLTQIAVAAVAATCLAACSSNSSSSAGSGAAASSTQTASAGQSAKVDRAAAVARAIRANPANADEILRQNGMTEQQYESLMYEIAADPAMSAEYSAKVGG